jgi:hypothetical protein
MYVSGDWLLDYHGDNGPEATYRVAYWAEKVDYQWNGWQQPRFSRAVAGEVVVEQQRYFNSQRDGEHANVSVATMVWDDDVIVVIDVSDDEPVVQRIGPDDDGLYPLGLDWCWVDMTKYLGPDGVVDGVVGGPGVVDQVLAEVDGWWERRQAIVGVRSPTLEEWQSSWQRSANDGIGLLHRLAKAVRDERMATK